MNIMSLDFWNVALDIAVLCFCACTIYLLFRNRRQSKALAVKRDSAVQWDDALIRRLLQKRQEPSFDQLLDMLKTNPEQAAQSLTEGPGSNRSHTVFEPEVAMIPKNNPPRFKDGGAPPTPNTYNRVAEMFHRGLSVKQISENLRMPVGEVELVLKLKRGIPVASMADKPGHFRPGLHPARS